MRWNSNGELIVAGISGGGGGGGGGGATQAEILAAINSANFNTASNSRYEFQLGSDDNGNYVIRYDKQTGIVSTLNTAGAPYTPVNPQPAVPEDREVRVTQYQAITTNATNWAPEDILERVQVLDVSGTTISIVSTQWFRQNGTTLSAVPVIGTDVVLDSRIELNRLALLQSIADSNASMLVLEQKEGNQIDLPVHNVYTSVLGINLLAPTSTTDWVDLWIDGKQYKEFAARIEASLDITSGNIQFFGSNTSAGPDRTPLIYTNNGGLEYSSEPFTVAPGQNGFIVLNPGFRYVRCEAVTPVAGTGLRGTTFRASPINSPASIAGNVLVSGIGGSSAVPAIVNGGDGELIPQAKRTNIELAALNAKTPALLPNAVPNTTVYKGFADTLPAVTNTTAAGGSGGFARLKALYHANGATQHYLQIHIDNGAPIAGDVPVDVYRLRANSTDIIDDVYSKNSGSVVLADGTTGFAVPAGSSVFIVRSSTPETYTPVTLSAASAAQISLAISRSW